MDHAPSSPAAAPPVIIPAAPIAPVDLRPLTTSELIDRGFSLYRAHFAGFLLLALVCQTAPMLAQILITTVFKLNPTPQDFLQNLPGMFAKLGWITVISLSSQVIAFGCEVVITFYVSDAYLGKIPSVKECIRKFRICIGPAVGICILNRILIALTLIFPAVVVGVFCIYIHYYPPASLLPHASLLWRLPSLILHFAGSAVDRLHAVDGHHTRACP